MASLGQHLRRHEEPPNGRLAFRRDCPICCTERTAGPLPDDRIVPLKAQVTIAIGALVAGGALPSAVAFADRGDGSGQAIAVEAPRVPVPPKHVAAPPDALGAAAAPVSAESDDPASEDVGRAEGDDAVGQDQAGASQAPPAPPTRTVTEASDEKAAPAATTSPLPEPSAVDEDHTQTTARGGDEPSLDPGAAPATAPAPARRQPQPAARPVSKGTQQLQPRSTADRPQTGGTRAAPAGRGTARGADASRPERKRERATAEQTAAPESRTYVVKDGDCLWNVAAHQLGAGAGDAAIAKEVTRLWKLNAEHIGTDDPDLIFTGQTLVL